MFLEKKKKYFAWTMHCCRFNYNVNNGIDNNLIDHQIALDNLYIYITK